MSPSHDRSWLTVHRTHRPACRATRRACEAAAMLGVSAPELLKSPAPNPAAFDIELSPGSLILITGPSGSGKSTALRDIAGSARPAGYTVIAPRRRPLPDRPAIDLAPGRVEHAMRLLAAAGLGEASCFVRRPSELSEGQRARLSLALSIERARRRAKSGTTTLLCCDEFASSLDAPHARALARLFSRLSDPTNGLHLAAALATPRDDLADALSPSTHIRCLHAGRALVEHAQRRERTQDPPLIMRTGTMGDYQSLAHLHYRAGPPATIARLIAAECPHTRALAGVLVLSMPTLNTSWRDLAWPGRYTTGDRAEDARRANRELRCISRVIVDPAWRSMGVASRLVRAYLDRPDTPCTEALAAMGGVCPFFERAGMTSYTIPPSKRDARLLDAIEHAGVEPWRLALPIEALRRAVANAGAPFIERELRRWARDSRATVRRARDDLATLFTGACAAIASRPIAYAHTR